MTTGTLPRPGPLWGLAPQRLHHDVPFSAPRWHSTRHYLRLAARAAQAGDFALDDPRARAAMRARLRRDGLTPETIVAALGAAAAAARHALRREPFETQLCAAAILLDGRMADMATGEGKTIAAALAAAVAALAGMPVHVVTANDYLAARDAQQLAPFYAALGLTVAHLDPGADTNAKHSIYCRDVVYATAKELAFDHLRDQLAAGAPLHELERRAAAIGRGGHAMPALTRGRCVAILDEADSILLDEADIPLVISRATPHAGRRAYLWQAIGIARQLVANGDYELLAHDPAARLTPAGRTRVTSLAAALGGPWRRTRYAIDAVTLALTGLHALRRGEHYVVRSGRVELLDAVTGRAAPGRIWSRGLHSVVEIKEGIAPSPDTETLAQTSFQRYFLGYWRLAGMSGSLLDARAELQSVYGLRVVRVPLRQPNRHVDAPPRAFSSAAARWAAICEHVSELQTAGRPVLIGTDSVADSEALSACLHRAGIAHQVLNALNDAAEAQIVAHAGRAGHITVATRMAGRGTDIVLDDAARAAGGLHVISCQRNPSRRLDCQLIGRCARQGDPGSQTAWLLASLSPHGPSDPAPILTGCDTIDTRPISALSTRWIQWQFKRQQHREETRRRRLRRALFEQDLRWSRRLAFAGRAA